MEKQEIWFDKDKIYLKIGDGIEKYMPLSWFPRLKNASNQERQNYSFSPFGIHWQDLDEDLSFEGFFKFDKEKRGIKN